MNLLGCSDVWADMVSKDEFVAIVAITLGCAMGMVAIVSSAIAGVIKTKARESTRRELAAYVAEGSVTPDDAVAMINAGRPHWESGRKA